MDIRIGDWVRFTSNRILYIGQVEYIKHTERLRQFYSSDVELVTSCGTIREDEVLEVRRQALE